MVRHQHPSQSRLPPIALVLTVIAALYFAREILIPLAIAVLLAFLLTPAVRKLEAWRLGRVTAVLMVAVLSLALVGSIGWMVTSQLIEAIGRLPEYKANIEKKVEAVRGRPGGAIARATQSVKELGKELATTPKDAPAELPRDPSRTQRAASPPPTIQKPVPVELVEPPPNALQSVRDVVGPMLAPVGTAGIVIVFTIVILIRREDLRQRLLRLIGVSQMTIATKALDDAGTRISKYLRMQFLVNATFATLLTAGLYFVGVPTPLLWGVLGGLARFVPYVGPLVGGSMPFIVSLAVFPGWQQPLLTLGLFVLIELTVAYGVEPWLYGAHTGISSLAILVSAAFWTSLWGPVGLVVSTPLTACLVVLGRNVPRLEFLYVILGDDPVLPPKAHLYQRLLALDRQEAQAAVEQFASEMSTLELYDGVILPALAMAEEERHRGGLEESHETFIEQIVVEFIEKLTAVSDTSDAKLASEAKFAGKPRRLICLPAADRADELAAAMLAQVMHEFGVTTICLSYEGPNTDTLQHLSLEAGDVVCVSALPPFALLSARTLSKKLRERFPNLSILVGIWGTEESGAYMERLRKAFDVDVVTTLAQAVEIVAGDRDENAPKALAS